MYKELPNLEGVQVDSESFARAPPRRGTKVCVIKSASHGNNVLFRAFFRSLRLRAITASSFPSMLLARTISGQSELVLDVAAFALW